MKTTRKRAESRVASLTRRFAERIKTESDGALFDDERFFVTIVAAIHVEIERRGYEWNEDAEEWEKT